MSELQCPTARQESRLLAAHEWWQGFAFCLLSLISLDTCCRNCLASHSIAEEQESALCSSLCELFLNYHPPCTDVSIVNEKAVSLDEFARRLGFRVEAYHGSEGTLPPTPGNHILVATIEKVERLFNFPTITHLLVDRPIQL